MRAPLIAAVVLSTMASAAGADKPLQQDKARMAALLKENLDWNRQTLGAEYERAGKKDPRWDAAARQALDLAAQYFSQQTEPWVSPTQIYNAARKAVAAGCDDPMILYLYGRMSAGANYPGPAEYTRRMQAAADTLWSSRYSPIRRAVAMTFSYQVDPITAASTPEARHKVEQILEAILDLLADSVAQDPKGFAWYRNWFDNLLAEIYGYEMLGMTYKAAYDRVDARLGKVVGIEPLRLLFKGNAYINWGWEARTTAFAPFVGDQQFRDLRSRLTVARAALEQAWKLEHHLPRVAQLRIEVEKAIGDGDRAKMETWFERAMEANPNDYHACWSKLDWLDPKWHGGDSFNEMMAFGRACKASGNWVSGITLIGVDAYNRYSSRLPFEESREYLSSPVVWGDIRTVYEQYLKYYPDRYDERSKYAYLCYAAGYYDEANRQFKILGDNLTTWEKYPNVPLAGLKQVRDAVAKGKNPRPKSDGPAEPDH